MTIEKIIIEYCAFQRRLMASLIALYPEILGNRMLFGLPTKTQIVVDGQNWHVYKHGVGFCFTRQNAPPALVVEVHDRVEEFDYIDAWRISLFTESIGIVMSEEGARKMVQKAVELGVVYRDQKGALRLKDEYSNHMPSL